MAAPRQEGLAKAMSRTRTGTNARRASHREPRFKDIQGRISITGVQWHFLPSAAPHFGGLWEASVKSVKHHLKRCLGKQTCTSEELTTFLSRVEACLNSHPIAPSSDHVDDYQALTPRHFLIGTALIAPPEPSVLDVREQRLSRWHQIQRMTEQFWKTWSSDYLHTLQQQSKWHTANRWAKIGRMVLLRNSNAPPSHWELGRIIACHPGEGFAL